MGKLSVAKVRAAGPGRHGDGDGLYLLVKPSGARSWLLRVQQDGRRRDLGLGAAKTDARDRDDPALELPLLQRRVLTLEEARDKAAALRGLSRAGLDPLAERDRDRKKVTIPTFAQAVKDAHTELGKGWAQKTAEAFKVSLETHAVPTLGEHRVDSIETEHVIAALAPIWTEKPQQARKIRHRILQVLSFAKSRGWRTAPVPAAEEVRRGLAKQPKSKGFAAVPYAEVPALVASELGKSETAARLALLFTILTGARSGEVRQARWEQIDREARTWSRPAELMKSREAHIVTLNPAALAVLDRAGAKWGSEGLVFPSSKPGVALSDMALSKMMRLADRAETVHGFRSSFRDWAAEQMPTVPAMVAEMTLAHSVGTATEKAYLRSDLRELRFRLMDAWGRFVAPSLCSIGSNVVVMEARA